MTLDPVPLLLIRCLLSGLVLAGGIAKLTDVPSAARAISGYRMVPYQYLTPSAWLVGLAEAGLGVAAILPLEGASRFAMFGIAGLLCLYAGAMAWNLANGHRDVDCGCLGFGAKKTKIGWPLVGRNLLLAALAVAGSLAVSSGRTLIWIDGLGLIFGFVTLALLYAGFEIVLSLPGLKERT